jgi:hypothetical protein
MAIHRFSPSLRGAMIATAVTTALACTALPVMAGSGYTETVSVYQRELDPQVAQIAVDTGRALVRDMNGALAHLNSNDMQLARGEVKKGLSLANALQAILPYTVVVDKLVDQRGKVDYQDQQAFQDDILPIYSDIEELEVFAPQAAAKAKQHLSEANRHMKAGDKQAAKESLKAVSDDISEGTAYLPVGYVHTELRTADSALSKKSPDTGAARTALQNALQSVTAFVDETDVTQRTQTTRGQG